MNELFSAVADSLPRVAALTALAGAIVLIIAWCCCIAWAWKDARSRAAAPATQLALVAPVVAGGLAGLPLYLAIRPLQRRADARAAERYLDVLLERIEEHGSYCGCGSAIQPDWVYCPTCSLSLQSACSKCGAHGPMSWAVCAYCGADHPAPESRPRLLPAPAAQRRPALLGAGGQAPTPPAPAPQSAPARAEVSA